MVNIIFLIKTTKMVIITYKVLINVIKISVRSVNSSQKTCNTGYRRPNLPKTERTFKNKTTQNLKINNKLVSLLRDKSLQKTRKPYEENRKYSAA